METKIDKRTKEYRDSQNGASSVASDREDDQGEPSAETLPPEDPDWVDEKERVMVPALGRPQGGDVTVVGAVPPELIPDRLDAILALLREIHKHIVNPPVVLDPATNEILRIEPTPKPVGDLTRCMKCGDELPPTETPRQVLELCHDCVWRNSRNENHQ